MTRTDRDRDFVTDLARTVVIGSLMEWLVDCIFGWFEHREAAKYRRERLERARPRAIRPSQMWWDEGPDCAGR